MPRHPRRGRRFQSMRKTGPTSCDDCQARIVWVKMTYTGKRIAVDPIPVADGNVSARLIGRDLHGYVISKEHRHGPPNTRYAAHYGTCSDRPPPKPKPEPPPALFDLGDS